MAMRSTAAKGAANIFHEDDERIWKALDCETYNQTSAYNVPGFKSLHREINHGPVTITGKLPKDLEGAAAALLKKKRQRHLSRC
jgi:hypothetical protein